MAESLNLQIYSMLHIVTVQRSWFCLLQVRQQFIFWHIYDVVKAELLTWTAKLPRNNWRLLETPSCTVIMWNRNVTHKMRNVEKMSVAETFHFWLRRQAMEEVTLAAIADPTAWQVLTWKWELTYNYKLLSIIAFQPHCLNWPVVLVHLMTEHQLTTGKNAVN